ncbi:MAG: THUMP-like domain-containing protein [Odoribacter splanchnicus]
MKQLYRQIPKANLTTRNFPLTVAELRKRSNIKEGGDIYLFATTLYSGQRVLIRTHKTH